MGIISKIKEWAVPAVVSAIVVGGIAVTIGNMAGSGEMKVELPAQLSAPAKRGQVAFSDNCASCHGENGKGTVDEGRGPPLIHDFYNPGHHGDNAFYSAAKNGVPAHHWPFGDMPPQPQVTEKEVADIIAFIREVQKENGIRYRAHH